VPVEDLDDPGKVEWWNYTVVCGRSRSRGRTSAEFLATVVSGPRRQRGIKVNRLTCDSRRLNATFEGQHVHADHIIETEHVDVELRHLMHGSTKLALTHRFYDPPRPPLIRRLNGYEHVDSVSRGCRVGREGLRKEPPTMMRVWCSTVLVASSRRVLVVLRAFLSLRTEVQARWPKSC
jgi:hypothetical protein